MGNRQTATWAAMAAWGLFAAAALWLTRQGLALDTDSAMRLAQVRDLLHGQSWFDTVQHRMNTPYGLPMHWSRLVDAPLALMALVSERFAQTAWPLGLLLAALLLLGRIAFALGGSKAAVSVAALVLLCTELYAPFTPGNMDHHGLQLVLMLAALAGLVEQRPRVAALAVALGLGVGLESLPYVAIACAAAALWLRNDTVKARAFGITLAAAATFLWLGTTADPYRLSPACDTYSLFYALLLAAGGAGLAGLSVLPRHRITGLAVLAAALLALAGVTRPDCLAGPYAGMDARLQAIWLSRINEAHPVWDFFRLAPSQVAGGYLYAAAALALTFLAPPSRGRILPRARISALESGELAAAGQERLADAGRSPASEGRRGKWLVMVFAAVALLVATLQYRAVPFAIVFALPGAAAGLSYALRNRSIVWLAAAILVCSSGAFTLAGAMAEGQDKVALRVMAFHAQEDCGGEKAMAALKALPPGRVAAFVDQGPAILAYTGDAAIAGPYHRDAAGILDSYAIFAGPYPRAALKRRGIDYVMTCRAAPDWQFYGREKGLVAQLAAGRVPDWLKPADRSGDVEVYRVKSR